MTKGAHETHLRELTAPYKWGGGHATYWLAVCSCGWETVAYRSKQGAAAWAHEHERPHEERSER